MFALNKKAISRLLLAAGGILWLLTFFISVKSIDYDQTFEHPSPILESLRDTFFSLFSLAFFFYYSERSRKNKGLNFNEILWKGFVFGALSVVGLLLTNFTITLVDPNMIFFDYDDPYPYYVNGFYLTTCTFIVIFLSNTFYVFKRMILYQKTKNLLLSWKIFEYTALAAIISNFWDIEFGGSTFYEILGGVAVFALILSVNVKWVAYLNFRQKLRGIGVMLAILLVAGTFLQYLYEQHMNYSEFLEIDLATKIFYLVIFAFIVIYSISSILVILFNLPTSSVFEQKFGEVYNFQRLSQSVKMGDDEEQIYQVIMEGSMSTVLADACWLEVSPNGNKNQAPVQINQGIGPENVEAIKFLTIQNGLLKPNEIAAVKNLRKYDASMPFRSLLAVPLQGNTKQIGTLFLLKKVQDGFDRELFEVLNTFIRQATVSIENARLVKEAIETERYKEELKIAENVQRRLLPKTLLSDDRVTMSAKSRSANEVGGDYYDIFHLEENKIAVVIGDVSGHGTQAAFNMAQLKGIFHSLIQLRLKPQEFMAHANSAVSRCLESSSFITLSLYYIDFDRKEINYARAGHCPTLYYENRKKSTNFLKTKGLGLGILRNEEYAAHIGTNSIKFSEGDILLLYTDGIVEARNTDGEEYDYSRLQAILQENVSRSTDKIIEKIEDDLTEFTGESELGDDYTLVAIKF